MCNCKGECQCHVFHRDIIDKALTTMPSDDDILQSSELLKILSDPQKLKIIHAIKHESLCVCDLGYMTGVTKSAISHQMKKLKKLDLVKSNKQGKMVYYSLKKVEVLDVLEKLENFIKGVKDHA